MILTSLFFIFSVFLIDFYIGIFINRHASKHKKLFFKRIHLGLIIAFLVVELFLIIYIQLSGFPEYIKYRDIFYVIGLFMIIYLPKAAMVLFFLFADLFRFLNKKTIARIFLFIGFAFGLFTFYNVVWGFLIGKYDFEVRRVTIESPDIPKAFDGFKITQFSDMHLGSFSSSVDINKGLSLIQALNPDIIVFTGDMINVDVLEAHLWKDEFKVLQAPFGKYSILGNHDLGDYRRWFSKSEGNEENAELAKVEEDMGFKVLINEHVIIKKDHDSILLIGVNNWGLPPFKQYGNIDKAMNGNFSDMFKILLSHDPTHWENKVLKHTNINLTLSGHTHGWQFGIHWFGLEWSPIALKYARWAGLYSENGQYLYVNRGMGFIGFPGRIGMRPEITLFTLKRK
ncbi:MAG: metallophosphoesterase [Thermoplasmata archaeon]